MKHYALVSECGRQLDCKFFDSLEDATTELELTYKHCLLGVTVKLTSQKIRVKLLLQMIAVALKHQSTTTVTLKFLRLSNSCLN